MKKPRYLLLGYKHPRWAKLQKFREAPERISGEVIALFHGTAEEVIIAAAAAPCGVLLVDLDAVPTRKTLAQGEL